MSTKTTQPVLDYIRANWEQSFYHDANGSGFCGIDLPFPYTSPAIKSAHNYTFFFYWDTFFTNLGLLRNDHSEMARNNIRNMFWYVKREGFMPNHVACENRSQAPYLCRMVRSYLSTNEDKSFVAEAAEVLRMEYHFWNLARSTPSGLSRHSHHGTWEDCEKMYNEVGGRIRLPQDVPLADKRRIGGHYIAECEVRDFTPRFEGRCMDYNEVELNALLYDYEIYLGELSKELGWDDTALWQRRAEHRAERIRRLLWNEERGLYLDYDFIHDRPSPVAGIVTYIPLWLGVASPSEAARVRNNLPLFERAFGVADTEDSPLCHGHQWAYPVVWPPMVYTTVMGLARYGYDEDARRIGQKFIDVSTALFAETGQLWEKTNAETGKTSDNEYKSVPLLGWSAGVFIALDEFLTSGKGQW